HLFLSGRRAPNTDRRPPGSPTYLLPDEEFLNELENRYGAGPHDLRDNEEMLSLVLPALRADMEIHETYRYQPKSVLSCPITAFAGEQDSRITREELEGWQLETTGAFRARTFPGGHFYLHDHEEALVGELRKDLVPAY
ncbi:thioesterase II family protein, partial [Planctomycetota bacterium]